MRVPGCAERHPRGYAPLLSSHISIVFVKVFIILTVCNYTTVDIKMSTWGFGSPPDLVPLFERCLSQCAAALLILIHQATAHAVKFYTVDLFSYSPNRCQSSYYHSVTSDSLNKAINATALRSGPGMQTRARLCNRHVNASSLCQLPFQSMRTPVFISKRSTPSCHRMWGAMERVWVCRAHGALMLNLCTTSANKSATDAHEMISFQGAGVVVCSEGACVHVVYKKKG